jgi:hypothetical protein
MQMLENNWQIVEDNTKESFRLAKSDIINFGIQLAKVQQAQRQLSELVGELKSIEFQQCNHQLPDFSGIYTRTDMLAAEIEALKRDSSPAVEAEIADLRHRHDALVGITKELIETLENKLSQQKPKIITRVRTITKIVKIAPKREYIASKATMRVHDRHCPFSRNVKRKNKIVFKTRLTAFKKGYKACKCLK